MPRRSRSRPRSLAEELEAYDAHRKWRKWYEGDKEGPQPPPSYKDCRNCRERDDKRTDEAAAAMCRECPWERGSEWESLPPGPPRRFYYLQELAAYGDAVCVDWYRRGLLTDQDMRDLETIRRWRAVPGGLLGG